MTPSGVMATNKVTMERAFDRLTLLPNAASRLKLLSRHRMLSPLTVERLDEAVSSLLRVDLKKASRLAATAVTLANRLGDTVSRAYALRAKANSLWFLGENRQASHLHAQATRLFEAAGNTVEAGRTLSSSIQPLILMGEYERALMAAQRAREIFSAAGETSRLARLDINVGNIFHRQDRFREALDYYERAYSQLLLPNDTEGMMAAVHNAALCLIMLNEYEKAEAAYDVVRRLGQAGRMPLAVAQAEYNIAYLYYLRGHYGRAIERLREAREFSQKVGDRYHAALCQLDLSEIYLELNLSQDAAELAQEAFTCFDQLGMGYEAAKALCSSAIALSQQGGGVRALELFAEARSLLVKEKNQVWPSLIDLYQALVYFREGRLQQARRHCLAALNVFRASPLLNKSILCRLLLARLSLEAGQIKAARRECKAALRKLSMKQTPILSYQAHLVMGQIEEAKHRFSRAQGHYQLAAGVLDTLRSGVHGEELKISFMSNRLEVYENLVGVCLARGSTPETRAEAWACMERAKSRSLLELIARQTNPLVAAGHGKNGSLRQIMELREQLNWYYHRIEAEQLGQVPASNKRLLALQKLAETREQKFLKAIQEANIPDAELAGVTVPKPVSLDRLRESLGSRATLVEYFRVRDNILASVVTEDGVEVTPVTRTSRIVQPLRMLQFQFSKFRLNPSYVRKFQTALLEATRVHLQELYQELVGPVRHQLKGPHLIVVPHESLHCVPFHALFDGAAYLVDSFSVSYAPSASIYVECCQKQASQAGGSLILGVPDRRAPAIREEMQSVAATLPRSEVFLGRKASAKILQEKGSQSRLIHIASHGFFRQDKPIFSGIRLGDTFLTLYDLYRLRLPVDQITLSGCSTGTSVVAAGDELIGLVRGLLSAGARTLLLTLWDVNDSSTATFMKIFYNRLLHGSDRASALRDAMAALRELHPHPYYWAPFVLVGNFLSVDPL
jgi:CHAT domain-containing protein